MKKSDVLGILGIILIIIAMFHFFCFTSYLRVSKKLYIMKNGNTTFAYVYDRNITRNSDDLLYKFIIKDDTIKGRMNTRHGINIGDSVRIMYFIPNPQKNLFIEDTAHTSGDKFFYNIYN